MGSGRIDIIPWHHARLLLSQGQHRGSLFKLFYMFRFAKCGPDSHLEPPSWQNKMPPPGSIHKLTRCSAFSSTTASEHLFHRGEFGKSHQQNEGNRRKKRARKCNRAKLQNVVQAIGSAGSMIAVCLEQVLLNRTFILEQVVTNRNISSNT